MKIHLPISEIKFDFARSSGPGGQNVNKVNSKVIMSWNVMNSNFLSQERKMRFLQRFQTRVTNEGEVVITSDLYRDRPRNMNACKEKLLDMLASIWQPPKPRKATRPTKASVRRRIDSKKQNAERKKSRQKYRFD